MLVNFRKGIIFVKTAKTGGTATEVLLQRTLRDEEVSHGQSWKVYSDGFVTLRPRGTLAHRQRPTAFLSPS